MYPDTNDVFILIAVTASSVQEHLIDISMRGDFEECQKLKKMKQTQYSTFECETVMCSTRVRFLEMIEMGVTVNLCTHCLSSTTSVHWQHR